MIIHEALQTLGLSHKETDVYLALLKIGPGSIRDIADAAGINRGTTYEILKLLREKSMVSYLPRGKRKFFCAEPPENLLVMAQEQANQLNRVTQTLEQDIVPDLNSLGPQFGSTSVRHYEGDDGIEYVLKDILRTVSHHDEKLYRVYSSKLIRKYLYRPFPNFTRQRVQKQIYVNVIAIGDGGEDAPLAARKWIPTENITPGASYVAVYPPKCAMISLTQGDHPVAIVIESESIAEALKLSFDTLWQLL